MTLYNPNNLIGNPKLDAKIQDAESSDSITDDNYLYAASASDMTGLARTIAHNEYETQSYEELYPYLPPVPENTVGSAADGIHAEYRTEVTKQSKH
ncbi:MAG: hypothetical protein IJO60_01515 [Agathobacter sp.]|nr:hypothetical protein [Agathobacter sp.]